MNRNWATSTHQRFGLRQASGALGNVLCRQESARGLAQSKTFGLLVDFIVTPLYSAGLSVTGMPCRNPSSGLSTTTRNRYTNEVRNSVVSTFLGVNSARGDI